MKTKIGSTILSQNAGTDGGKNEIKEINWCFPPFFLSIKQRGFYDTTKRTKMPTELS